jgi:hypothetical protein
MSKQTALQWFLDKLPHSIETQFSKQIQEAMQMEREQIEEAFNVYGTYAEAAEYYDEMYGDKKMKTPLQQIKDNYYKMSESQFHYWVSQNIGKLVQEEKVTVVEAYEKGHTDREDNLYKLRVYLNTLYGTQNLKQEEWGDYM